MGEWEDWEKYEWEEGRSGRSGRTWSEGVEECGSRTSGRTWSGGVDECGSRMGGLEVRGVEQGDLRPRPLGGVEEWGIRRRVEDWRSRSERSGAKGHETLPARTARFRGRSERRGARAPARGSGGAGEQEKSGGLE